MYQRYRGSIVQIIHTPGDLNGPVDQNIWPYLTSLEHLVERAATRVLHDQAQVRYLQTDAQHRHNVLVVQQPEQIGLLLDVLDSLADVLVGVLARCFDGHLLVVPIAAVHLAETADADHLFQLELLELDFSDVIIADGRVHDEVGREYAHLVAELAGPPALVAGYLGVGGQHLDDVAALQAQLVLALRVVPELGRPQRQAGRLGGGRLLAPVVAALVFVTRPVHGAVPRSRRRRRRRRRRHRGVRRRVAAALQVLRRVAETRTDVFHGRRRRRHSVTAAT